MKLLDVNGLSKSFGGVTALRQVQGHSVAGETLGMIGPNVDLVVHQNGNAHQASICMAC